MEPAMISAFWPITPTAANEMARSYPALSYWVGAALIVLVVVLGWRSGRKRTDGSPGRSFSVLYGADGRPSTSKLTAFAWIAAVVAASGMLLTAVVLGTVTLAQTNLDQLPPEYLVLMGAPLGSLILAKGITEAKVAGGTLQKPEPGVAAGLGSGGFTSDDSGQADLVDIQYLSFNAVLLLYFAGAVIADARVPELPDILVGLSGVSAAAYVAKKALATNPPSIVGVTVDGATLRIRGQNLLKPQDPKDYRDRVTVDGAEVHNVDLWSDDGTMINVTMTQPLMKDSNVTVTTAAGATVTSNTSA